MRLLCVGLLAVVCRLRLVESILSDTFLKFVTSAYGGNIAQRLNRADLGAVGSFGGGSHIPGQPTAHEPVIIVHGITNNAHTFGVIRDYFLSHGYGQHEVYGTTYGDAGRTPVFFVNLECDYVRRVRELIITVSAFAHSKVDVLAYSMGSPIARKAIMGGRCVDTGENLGGPLTSVVDTFVGVAGANFGSFLCVIPFGSCNMNNGMHCQSRFITDINSRPRYEGSFIFTIYSTDDDKVGYISCGRIASSIVGQNKGIQHSKKNHDAVMRDTVGTQFNLVTAHRE